MSFVLKEVRDDILATVRSRMAQPVYVGGVPMTETIVFNNGVITPYILVNFGDMAQAGSRSFIGARGDGHYSFVNFFCIAGDITTPSGPVSGAELAMDVQSLLIDKMLGYKPPYASQMTKSPGGAGFVLLDRTDSIQAYVAATSFRVHYQIVDVP